jgi:hypothetical protein
MTAHVTTRAPARWLRRPRIRHEALERGSSLVEWPRAKVGAVDGEHVERDEGGRRLVSQPGDAGSGGMEPRQQRLEVEALGADDHDLAVELHKIEERSIARAGQVVIRSMMYVALSYLSA